jgi:hypothetical protein
MYDIKVLEYDPRFYEDFSLLEKVANHLYTIGIKPSDYTGPMKILIDGNDKVLMGKLVIHLNNQKLEFTSSHHNAGDYPGVYNELFHSFLNCIENQEAIIGAYNTSKKNAYATKSVEIREDAKHVGWADLTINGIKGFFTDVRINKETIPAFFNVYEVADNGPNCDLMIYCEHVQSRFCGTFISMDELPIHDKTIMIGYIKSANNYTIQYPGNDLSFDDILKLTIKEEKDEEEEGQGQEVSQKDEND